MSKDKNVRSRVLKHLRAAVPNAVSPTDARRVEDIADATGLKKNSVRGALIALERTGEAERVEKGLYRADAR